jgi:hypothetical protein
MENTSVYTQCGSPMYKTSMRKCIRFTQPMHVYDVLGKLFFFGQETRQSP